MYPLNEDDFETIRKLLCALGDTVRDEVLRVRAGGNSGFSEIMTETAADTIYRVDAVSEAVILTWFREHWPRRIPVTLVMEGLEDRGVVTFPDGLRAEQTVCTCIIDPIDGTRNIMYDKRSAWVLAAVAPRHTEKEPHLSDITVAAMTEVPTVKQTFADQVSAIRGGGVIAERIDLREGRRAPLSLRPSQATDFRHGFSSFVRFFPEGKSLMAKVEEELWGSFYGLGEERSPLVFDDQYISTGGQLYEILSGHDRMLGDLRPLVYAKLGYDSLLTCHPYDFCTALLLEEAGAVVESPAGEAVDAPLDTTSPVAWIVYANPVLADQVRPVLQRLIERYLFG